jgi:hypothetical protein
VASLGSSVRIAGRGRAITAGRLSIWGGGLYAYEMNRIEIACCPHCPVGFLIIVALRLSRSVHTVHQTHRESERFDSSVCLFQAHSSLRNRGSSSSFIFLRNEAVTLESPRRRGWRGCLLHCNAGCQAGQHPGRQETMCGDTRNER